ncbi:hypothetical protein Tco_1572811, partial [Tanacetum coccineum]
NPGIQNVGNQNGLIVVLRIANQNKNQNGNGNVVAARAEGDLDEIEEVNANCILIANLQQASTSGTQTYKAPVYDSDGSAKCLTKKINALHLSSAKTITALNEEIANLNKQVSKEKSTVSFLQEERKRLKSDFKTREDALLDEQIQLENKQAQQKQQSLYNGKVLLEKHDPSAVHDLEETLELAQESRDM